MPSITKYAVKTSPNDNLFLPFSSFAQNSVFRENIHHIYFHQRLIYTRHFALQNIYVFKAPIYIVFLKKVWKISTYLSHIVFIYIFIHINFGANDVIDTGVSFYSTECTNVAYFNSIIIGFAPCHSTIILPGNVWQQESFQSPSVISNSG